MARRAQGGSADRAARSSARPGVRAHSVRLLAFSAVRAAAGRYDAMARSSSGGRLRMLVGVRLGGAGGAAMMIAGRCGGGVEEIGFGLLVLERLDVVVLLAIVEAYNPLPSLIGEHTE